jgi:hypothetical protein
MSDAPTFASLVGKCAMKDQTRNLNPTPEAIIAMAMWGYRYGAQLGGSMDFWDTLSEAEKRDCLALVARIKDADSRQRRD